MLSEADINAKLQRYVKTPAGKAKVDQYVNRLRRTGGKTANGTEVLSLGKMCSLADELVKMVKEEARKSGATEAIMDEINSLTYVYTDMGNGQYCFYLRFTADTHRDSMMPKLYPNGIDNIIALFNTGYVAENPNWANVSGPPHMRPSLMFMQDAIKRFTDKYGNRYNLTVELNPIYTDGNWTVKALNE